MVHFDYLTREYYDGYNGKWLQEKFFPIPGENMAEFLKIHQIFPVLIHNKSTRPVGFIIADKIIDRMNMVEFSNKTRQFNPVIIFQSKVCIIEPTTWLLCSA